MPPSDQRSNRRLQQYQSNSDDNNNMNNMATPHLRADQIREFHTQNIFAAAVERASDEFEFGDASSLMRHSREIAADVPSSIDESYVLQLQSELVLARSIVDDLREQLEDPPMPTPSSSARQLANAASHTHHRRRHANDEAVAQNNQDLTLVAALQLDLSRTRERMSDALSVTRSHSHSLNLADFLNDNNGSSVSMDVDGLVIGPIERQLNDVDQYPRTEPPPANLAQGEEDLMASIATLQFDLQQTREKLMDERSFVRSGHLSNTDDEFVMEENVPEASSSSISELQPAQASSTDGDSALHPTSTTAEAVASATAAASNSGVVDSASSDVDVDAVSRVSHLLSQSSSTVVTSKADTPSGDNAARIRASDPMFRRFSNQMA